MLRRSHNLLSSERKHLLATPTPVITILVEFLLYLQKMEFNEIMALYNTKKRLHVKNIATHLNLYYSMIVIIQMELLNT